MQYEDTTTYATIEKMNARINICQGGSSSGKTIAILMILLDLSFEIKNETITVMTDTLPALRRGAMKDWRDILRGTERERYFTEKITEHTWVNQCTGARIEFMSCDDMGALGARREYLFVNEANRINYETFSQLEIRTLKKIWVDYNPSHRFWIMNEVMEKRNDWDFCKTTFLDNEALPQNIVDALLQRKGDGTNNFWRVYGLGELGSLEGNVYKNWIGEDEMPEGFILKRYGVDFGFSNDPTAVIAVYENEDKEIFAETMIYEKGLLTPELIEKMKRLPDALAACDNARPEIIAEMKRSGLRAIACDKTAGEKMNGKRYNIELVQRRIVHYLKSDQDLEKEYLSYAWRKKRSTGEYLDEPEDGNDHDLDGLSYAIRDMARRRIQF